MMHWGIATEVQPANIPIFRDSRTADRDQQKITTLASHILEAMATLEDSLPQKQVLDTTDFLPCMISTS